MGWPMRGIGESGRSVFDELCELGLLLKTILQQSGRAPGLFLDGTLSALMMRMRPVRTRMMSRLMMSMLIISLLIDCMAMMRHDMISCLLSLDRRCD